MIAVSIKAEVGIGTEKGQESKQVFKAFSLQLRHFRSASAFGFPCSLSDPDKGRQADVIQNPADCPVALGFGLPFLFRNKGEAGQPLLLCHPKLLVANQMRELMAFFFITRVTRGPFSY
jgi:hypothetical protein